MERSGTYREWYKKLIVVHRVRVSNEFGEASSSNSHGICTMGACPDCSTVTTRFLNIENV
jgi:hypothetical protein